VSSLDFLCGVLVLTGGCASHARPPATPSIPSNTVASVAASSQVQSVEAPRAEAPRVRCVASELAPSKNIIGPSRDGIVAGSLAVEPLRRRIATLAPQLRACYEASTARERSARIVVRFVIDANGAVPCAEVTQSDSIDSALDACVANAVAGLLFAGSGRGLVTVTYPFRFEPRGN
jgi:outer membrane biosynthesis protein TonB